MVLGFKFNTILLRLSTFITFFLCLFCRDNSMIFTIGHSNRLWTEFLSIIKHYDISVLVDVRRFPGSRLWPQFNKGYMEKELENHNIKYFHIEKLGGRRKEKRNDKNVPFENEE